MDPSRVRLFEPDDEVARLQAMLEQAPKGAALRTELILAWQLRERDTARARQLADDIAHRLAAAPEHAAERAGLQPRLRLLQAECLRLQAELPAALLEAQAATSEFNKQGDRCGMVDGCWVQALVLANQGQTQARDAVLEQGIALAQAAGDEERQLILEATLGRYQSFRELRAAEQRWSERFTALLPGLRAPAAAGVHLFFGSCAYRASDYAGAIQHFNRGFEAALKSGQLHNAITAAGNIGNAFTSLNDHDTALEWVQRALELARPTGWPASVGACLSQMGETLRRLQRLDLAEALLEEALQTLKPLEASRNYAVALKYRADLALDRGAYQQALDCYLMLEQRSSGPQGGDLQLEMQCGKAKALLQLGQLDAAGRVAQEALQQAVKAGLDDQQVEARQVLAAISGQLARQGQQPETSALEHLEQALQVAGRIAGYQASADLLSDLGQAYAQAGRHAEAYAASEQSVATRERLHSQVAHQRLMALQLRHMTENARAEAAHHKQMAEAEAKRAALLQRTSVTLERLGAIGQEITAHLDAESVFLTLHRHVHALLDAAGFCVYLMDADGLALTSVFDMENGQRLPSERVALNDPHSNSARCVRERRELSVHLAADGSDPSQVPGTMRTLSALFAPLMVGERVLGVMTLQSPHANAYAEHEWLIFRSLCAYTAIALDNASAYRHLKDAQAQLVAQEKLAALGALVAGVAHELNTPIGNSLLMASTLQQRSEEITQAAQDNSLRRSALMSYLADASSASQLIARGLSTAAALVASFKQVAADRTTEQRRVFDLAHTSQDIVATMMGAIRKSGHAIALEIPEGIRMDAYPGPFGQVLTNLINNALLHAFEGRSRGRMLLTAAPARPGWVELRFSDNGRGISAEHLHRIFEPFFTTKLGQGGSGLGLSISYNIVKSLFGGEIQVEAAPGGGCCFVLQLPLSAPEQPLDARLAAPERFS